MGSKSPPIPPAQRSRLGARSASMDDITPDVSHDAAGGNAHLNLKEQGRHGNLHQNIAHSRQQDR